MKYIDASCFQTYTSDMESIIARRAFSHLYIYLDTGFLLLFLCLLLWKRKYMTAAVGIIMGAVYMIVDFGIFHLLLGTRSIEGGNLFWVLLWMSMSYGFTNFAWIWLWLDKDENLFEWSLLILLWWFVCPLLTSSVPPDIMIQRTTGAYHLYMAAILFIGYLTAIIHNLRQRDRIYRIDIPYILIIGILVQFGWEAGLLLGGIRSAGLEPASALRTLIVNSLLETNLGIPYTYLIFIALTSRFTGDFRRREDPLTLRERIKEINLLKIRR